MQFWVETDIREMELYDGHDNYDIIAQGGLDSVESGVCMVT